MKRLITMVIVAGTLCACGGTSHENSEIRSVVLTEPVLLESTHVINRSGVVREAHTISLGFKTAGQIERIHVQEGDYIRRGQLLAELDAARLVAQHERWLDHIIADRTRFIVVHIAAADANVFQLDKNLVLFGCGDRAGGVAHLADAVHDCNFHCAFHKMTSVFICLLTFIKCL